jgi:hypothetical protein
LSIPAAKQWLRQLSSGRAFYFWSGVIIFAGSVAFIFLNAFDVLPYTRHTPYYGVIVFVTFAYITDSHGFGQSKGLSLIYNKKLRASGSLSERELKLLKRFELFQRVASDVLLFSIMGIYIFSTLHATDHFPIPAIAIYLTQVLKSVVLIATVGLVLTPVLEPRRSWNKVFFNLRFIFWPISMTSNLFAGIALMANHGIEYFFINRTLITRTEATPVERVKMLKTFFLCGSFFLFIGFTVIDGFPQLLIAKGLAQDLVFHITTTLMMTATMVHVFWDKYFYRFESKLGRQTSKPLVIGENSAA